MPIARGSLPRLFTAAASRNYGRRALAATADSAEAPLAWKRTAQAAYAVSSGKGSRHVLGWQEASASREPPQRSRTRRHSPHRNYAPLSAGCHRTIASSSAARGSEGSEVFLTSQRLDQLLMAEITTLAMEDMRPLEIQSILGSQEDGNALAKTLHEELPVRFARRIKLLEALPKWQEKERIAYVRKLYVTSFKELRLADLGDATEFQHTLCGIKERHSRTTFIVDGFREIARRKEMSEEEINEWLDHFFRLRVSTNMMIGNYLKLTRHVSSISGPEDGECDNKGAYQYSVSSKCRPDKMAMYARDIVTRMCLSRYGCAPEIEIIDKGARPFPCVPRYLFYILSELLKNAARATLEQPGATDPDKKLPPITVLVTCDDNVATIRISDKAGGIPVDQLDRIWSYLYSTAEDSDKATRTTCSSRTGVDMPTDVRMLRTDEELSLDDPTNPGSLSRSAGARVTALGGMGCGLRLSRLYAEYFGGKVELQTLPRYGTDVFVYFTSLGKEILPEY